MEHPQLNRRHFFKVYKSGYGIVSFIYSLMAALYSNTIHRNFMHSPNCYKRFVNTLNLQKITFSKDSLKQLKIFLKNNSNLNVKIILFEGRLSPKSGNIEVYQHSKIEHGKRIINILRLFNFEGKARRSYYFYLKNASTLTLLKRNRWCCLICFERFTSKQRLLNHLQSCNANGAHLKEAIYPKKGTYINFSKLDAAKYQSPLPIVGFADLEANLQSLIDCPPKNIDCKTCKGKLNCACYSYTQKLEKHQLVSYSLAFVDSK